MAQTVNQITGNFNTGNDRSVVLVDSRNNYINLGKIIKFMDTNDKKELDVAPINSGGIEYHQNIPAGHKGTITVVRENGVIDALQAAIEARYYNGLTPTYFQIFVTTRNQDGTINEVVYTGCSVWVNGGGTWQKDQSVELEIEFKAQQYQILS